jgi:hypothetical protein
MPKLTVSSEDLRRSLNFLYFGDTQTARRFRQLVIFDILTVAVFLRRSRAAGRWRKLAVSPSSVRQKSIRTMVITRPSHAPYVATTIHWGVSDGSRLQVFSAWICSAAVTSSSSMMRRI